MAHENNNDPRVWTADNKHRAHRRGWTLTPTGRFHLRYQSTRKYPNDEALLAYIQNAADSGSKFHQHALQVAAFRRLTS